MTTDYSDCDYIGPYYLTETIGYGANAKVKRAVHSKTLRQYACKILEMKRCNVREIEILGQLSHPNIVKLEFVMTSETKVYIVMELLAGGDLFDQVVVHKKLTEPYARFYFQQLIRGLRHCHTNGVYHRDLKPENLLLDEYRTLKIADFGTSALLTGESSTTTPFSSIVNTQCGTLNYVPPEIIRLDESEGYSGSKADIWACGIILFVFTAGYLPFEHETSNVLVQLIKRGIVSFPTHFSEALVDLITRLLNIDPAERYSLTDIERHPWYFGPVKNHMPNEVMPPTRNNSTRRRSQPSAGYGLSLTDLNEPELDPELQAWNNIRLDELGDPSEFPDEEL